MNYLRFFICIQLKDNSVTVLLSVTQHEMCLLINDWLFFELSVQVFIDHSIKQCGNNIQTLLTVEEV